jgi:hypothetical protein
LIREIWTTIEPIKKLVSRTRNDEPWPSQNHTATWSAHPALATTRAPSAGADSAAEVGPFVHICLAKHHGTRPPQPGHHTGVAPDHRPQQRHGTGRRVEPVPCCDVVFEQHGHAVQAAHLLPTGRGSPLCIGLRRLLEGIRVYLDHGVEQRIEASDLAQVESDERRRGNAAVLEPQVDVVV